MIRSFAAGDRLVLASHNKGKIAEFRELLAPMRIEIVSSADLGLPEPEETGDSFAANARLKAEATREGRRVCPRSPTIPASRSRHWAARPGFIRRAGPARAAISPPP